MLEAVINDAVRTPIFALGCAISAVRPDDLATLGVGVDQLEAMIVEWIDNVP
jgi:hypothetical protein